MLVQRGANGNVFGYNYSINATSDGNISQFNRLPDGSLHGLFPYMNLYEGNVMQEIHSADTWGPSGPGNTFFRNRICREGIRISDRSIDQNIVGNDLRKDASATYTQDVVTNESGVVNTLIHGNKVSGTVTWDQNLGSNNLINSYYLSSAPAFFNGAPWPALGPETALSSGTIPAETRYANGYDTECENVVNTTGVQEDPVSLNVSLFPNPASESVQVSMEIQKNSSLQIEFVSTLGQIVYSENLGVQSAGILEKNINVCALSAGIYQVLVSVNGNISQAKIIITK
jgi:hypothetical protein